MKQVLHDLKSGATMLADVPSPSPGANELLVRTRATLLSPGTERMLLEFGKANLLEKARQQPDKLRMVLDKARTDGVLATLETVRRRLDEPLPMGYCNVGTIVGLGARARGFALGERVVSNGKHAELTAVPCNLCARVPGHVNDESAAFAVLGAIALQGIRLAAPTLGEAFAVAGLGLVGLLAVQLLRANGCRVFAFDFNAERVALAAAFGAETLLLRPEVDPAPAALAFSRGRGVDGVILAAATRSAEPIHQAAAMCRRRGRIVLVGVTGLQLSRADFYEKELTFQVSCSYGPGRYDPAYEEGGADYPFGFVRWTAQRNFEAVLDLLASGSLDVARLVTHRFAFGDAPRAYEVLGGSEPHLGIVLDATVSEEPNAARTIALASNGERPRSPSAGTVGVIGAGNYGSAILIPAFRRAGAELRAIATLGGVRASVHGRRFGFALATTDADAVLADERIDTIVIATRHDLHAELVCRALRRGKHVFVEKPLALAHAEIDDIGAAYDEARRGSHPILMVGFNRRFAPHVVRCAELLAEVREPKSFVMTVNAGAIPREHWTQDVATGGGRIAGEACHFIDLLRFLAASPIASLHATALHNDPQGTGDTASLDLRFLDGSIGTIHYFARGHRSFPKERLEVFCGGRVLQLDNFRELRGFGWRGFRTVRSWRQDKGQHACVMRFIEAVRGGSPAPIPFEQLIEVATATLQAAEAVRETA
jgi:predicted dehydrogenase/NADPH:quinone reductase-like Zn-dependent oxidoreductase